MLVKILKFCVPPIFIIAFRGLRSKLTPSELFDGDDALFKNEVREVNVYGEYGCGKSTKWVLSNTSANVIAVETSSKWVSAVKRVNESSHHKLTIHHADLGEVGKWGRPLGYGRLNSFPEYTDFLWKQKELPELVLIDGRFRVCCFLTSLKFAEEGTKILFDDYSNRPQYHFVEKYVSPSKECGRQTMFIVPSKAGIDMVELEKDILSFRNVMD